jgi:2-succinyl-5-enolpyruvyl-6-hydroxy-3-cyclohexene-1-carboxylate synthase
MKLSNRTLLWAEIFVDELARAGLRHVCIAPGSRSTPLAIAFAGQPAIKVHSLLDERGAAFFGLGLALALDAPVALLCTSGTATVNFHPAIAEAYYAQVPLLVLTADRPHEVRDSGANQTMDQVKLYGDHVRWFVDVAPPEANPPAKTLRYLRTLACRALATAAGSPSGPVHLNFPFRKPLEPIPVPGDIPTQPARPVAWAIEGREGGQPFTALSRGLLTPSPQQVEALAEAIGGATRGLILCGPRCPGGEFPEAVVHLAQTAGFPILADALSGIRFSTSQGEASPVLGGYETFLQKEGASRWDSPELILQFGAMPTSQALINYLEAVSERSRRILFTGSGVWTDETHSLSDLIWADPALTCRAVTQQLERKTLANRDLYWRAAWEEAEKAVWQAVETAGQEAFFEGLLLADVVEAMPHQSLLYVASSLPVRHLDQFVAPKQSNLRVFANRGVSGIDGTISSALGAAAAATKRPLVLILGDIAFYHDLNGLLALQRCGVKATIVLINNDGGGIFHRLPIAQFDPPFSELFLTPHGLQFEPVVRMFGAHYQKAATRDSFRQRFQEALQAEQSWVIEVPTDSVQHEEMRRKIIKQVGEQLALVKV